MLRGFKKTPRKVRLAFIFLEAYVNPLDASLFGYKGRVGVTFATVVVILSACLVAEGTQKEQTVITPPALPSKTEASNCWETRESCHTAMTMVKFLGLSKAISAQMKLGWAGYRDVGW